MALTRKKATTIALDPAMDALLTRIRIPPPTSTDHPGFRDEELFTTTDHLQQTVMFNAIYCPRKVPMPRWTEYDTSIANVHYGFEQPELRGEESRFREALAETARSIDETWGTVIPLSELLQSTGY